MHSSLRQFASLYVGIVIATLVPVVLVAFMTIPTSLGGHPTDLLAPVAPLAQHMS